MASNADWLAALAQSNSLAVPTGRLPADDTAAQTMMWMGAGAPTLPVLAAPAPAPTGRFPVDVALTAAMAPARATPKAAPKKQTARLDTPIVDRTQPAAAPLAFPLGGVGSAMIVSPSMGASVARTKAAPAKSSIPDKVAPSKANPGNAKSPVSTAEAVRAAIAPVKEATPQDRALAAIDAILTKKGGFTLDEFQAATGALPGVVSANAKATLAPKQAVVAQAAAMSQQLFADQVTQAQELAKTDPEGARAAVGKAQNEYLQFLLSLSGANPANLAQAGLYGVDPDNLP